MRIGTLEWELKTGGRLSRLARLKMIAVAMRLRLLRRLSRWTDAGQAPRQRTELDFDRVWIPDTVAAREALEACAAASSPALLNHCIRTYIFGAFVAQMNKLTFDAELLYVTALLHDLGLTPTHRDQGVDCHCFAVAGARAAFRLSEKWNWPEERRNEMREAIVLHLNPSVPVSWGKEAHLLHAGAGIDVLGTQPPRLPLASVCGIFKRHPRQHIAPEVAAAMRAEAKMHPYGRVALWERFGFSDTIAMDRPGSWTS